MNDQIEFCHIEEGSAKIVLGDGSDFTVKAGDGFVMHNGLQSVLACGRHRQEAICRYEIGVASLNLVTQFALAFGSIAPLGSTTPTRVYV